MCSTDNAEDLFLAMEQDVKHQRWFYLPVKVILAVNAHVSVNAHFIFIRGHVQMYVSIYKMADR